MLSIYVSLHGILLRISAALDLVSLTIDAEALRILFPFTTKLWFLMSSVAGGISEGFLRLVEFEENLRLGVDDCTRVPIVG